MTAIYYRLKEHVERLRRCNQCEHMHWPAVSGGPVVSDVLLVGQAPGDKEPILGRPFAWTAGKTLFGWFEENCAIDETKFRKSIYMAAVCRCFPGKKPAGGDRVPSPDEIEKCSVWLKDEIGILKPKLVIPVGKLAITRFIPAEKLELVIGEQFECTFASVTFDLIPLPHPSGASPWHRMEPGKTLVRKALRKISRHPAFQKLLKPERQGRPAAT